MNSRLTTQNKQVMLRTYRLVAKANQKYLPFYLRSFCNDLFKPSFRVNYNSMEPDSIRYQYFVAKWYDYTQKLKKMDGKFKIVKAGQHFQ